MSEPFSWGSFGVHLANVAVAFVCALPLALDREKQSRGPGLRTFPLVAIASCSYMMLATMQMPDSPESHARVLQGLVSGMGFIGGGAILKHGEQVEGLANAAALWLMGAIGAACAFGRYEIAVALSLIAFATIHFASGFKAQL